MEPLYKAVTLGTTFSACNIRRGCITEVHYTSLTMYTRSHKGGLYREVAATYSNPILDVPLYVKTSTLLDVEECGDGASTVTRKEAEQ